MPYLQQDRTRLQTELQTLIAQQAPLNAQLATQQQAVTAAQAQRTNAVNAVAQAQAGRAYVFDALGDPVAEVRLPEGLWTTSVAFHPDRPGRLYIVDAQFGAVFTCDLPA